MSAIEVDVRGLEELRRRMAGAGEVIEAELRAATAAAVALGQREARLRAPVDTGRLRQSIATEVRGGLPELVGVVGTNVTAAGHPYPKALDESPRFHYRRGPFAGAPTAGYFSGVAALIAERVQGLFERAAARIAGRLNR